MKCDCAKDKAESMNQGNEMRNQVKRIHDMHQQTQNQVEQIIGELNYKADQSELDQINTRLETMPSSIEVKEVRVELFETIKKFSEDSKSFSVEFQKHTEIIARYDEILCQKCSISRLNTQRDEMEKRFDPQLSTLKTNLKTNDEKINQLELSFDYLMMTVEEKVQQGIRKFMEEREKINDAFDKDPHNSKVLNNRIQQSKLQMELQSKADRFELEDLSMMKCNRSDLNIVGEKVSSLQQEIAQLIMLFNESLKMNLAKDSSKVSQ